jgi:acyl-CoA synthetase (AMP-forming)/AMP-acid ligase II
VHAPRGAALVAALLGSWASGADFCVLDPAYPSPWLARQLDAAPPVAALLTAGTPPAELAARTPCIVPVTGGPTASPAARWPALGHRGYVGFTSGTTGAAKAVRSSGLPLAHFLDWYVRTLDLTAGDRYALLAGLAHDPLLRDVFVPLCTGATLCVPPEAAIRSPRELRQWLVAERVTVLHLTPPLLRLLTSVSSPLLNAVRLVVCGGDQLFVGDVTALRAAAPQATVINAYGTTETPQVMAWHAVGPGDPLGPPHGRVPVGTGIDGVQLLVRNASGCPAATGELGRVLVQTGYLADGLGTCYDTGDLGRVLPGGDIELVGRSGSQVKIAGYRIDPQEIDPILRELPGVGDARTAAIPGAGGRPRLVAYVTGPEPDPESLRSLLRRRLPAPLLPAAIVPLQALPLTPNGKLDLRRLPRTPSPAPGTRAGRTAQTSIERRVAGVWRDTLGCGEPNIDANFFDMGGTSLLMARAQVLLEQALRREIPMLTMFEYPTVRSLAAHLADLGAPASGVRHRRRPVSEDAGRRRLIRAELGNEDL